MNKIKNYILGIIKFPFIAINIIIAAIFIISIVGISTITNFGNNKTSLNLLDDIKEGIKNGIEEAKNKKCNS